MVDRSQNFCPASFYASPQEAAKTAPPEKLLYVACLDRGTRVERPDFIAVVDADPGSERYAQVVHETRMPNVGDELHHFGWNRCSSACHGPDRSHLIVPGFAPRVGAGSSATKGDTKWQRSPS